MHRDGYGFLVPDRSVDGMKGDLYLSREGVRGAMNGDRAIARITGERAGRVEGEIWKILKRAHPTVVGEFRINRRGMFVAPHDERLKDWIEIPERHHGHSAAETPQLDRIGA